MFTEKDKLVLEKCEEIVELLLDIFIDGDPVGMNVFGVQCTIEKMFFDLLEKQQKE